jgi:hypothetical protein
LRRSDGGATAGNLPAVSFVDPGFAGDTTGTSNDGTIHGTTFASGVRPHVRAEDDRMAVRTAAAVSACGIRSE